MRTQDRRLRERDRPTRAIILSWAAASLFLGLIALPHMIDNRLPDADDVQKVALVRDLLAGQEWSGLAGFGTGPGSVAAAPWSPLADLPLAGLVLLLAQFMEPAQAEQAAMVALPLLVLLLLLLVIGRLSWRLFDRPAAACACLVAVLLPGLAMEFQPLRVDHHGWQILAMMTAVWALSWRLNGRGGTVAGLAMSAGLTISLDLVVMAAGVGLVLALRWLRDHRERWWLVSYLQALALGLAVLFLLTRGPGAIAPSCEMISPPQLGFALILALGTGALAVLPPLPRLPLVLAWAGFAGLGFGFAALVGMQCPVPALGESTPLIPGIWPGFADDAGPLWQEPLGKFGPAMFQLPLALGVALYLASIHRDWQRAWWFEYALLLLLAIVGSILVARTLGYAGVLSAVPLGWFVIRLLKRWRAHDGILPKLALAAVLLLALGPGALVALAQCL